MSGDPLQIEALLESVADGSDIDWDAAEAAADEGQRRVVRNLRLVASIAQVHRSISDDRPPGSAALPTITAEPTASRWGHLLLLERIGEGTFAEVYRARDPWLDRNVALKLLKPDIASPSRLVGEAQALARMRHPNVVTVHGADMHDGRVGLWMELVRGRTLASIVTSEGPFSAAEAMVIGQELCRAVAAVHAVGLVHRDIKAQNVMRESGGRVVLMDFGAGHTPLYLAPEVMDGGEATVASDIYALGVLLYYLVVGKYPVAGSSIDELKRAHARGERKRLVEARPDLPDAFAAVVERAMHPDPTQRFATAPEMQQALAAGSDRSLEHSAGTRAPALAPLAWVMPGRAWAWLAAAALLAVAAVAGLSQMRDAGAPSPSVQVIAVLPFENLSKASTESYLANAVPMELTARLGTIGALRVVPWTFMTRFQSTAAKLDDIARSTNADALVEGSVLLLDGPASAAEDRRVRIRVQLYRAGTGAMLWTESYERPLSEFLTLQGDIAQAIATEVNAVIARREQAQVSRARRVAPAAMEDYLRGREALEARYDIRSAIAMFQSAVKREPQFPDAHGWLALVHALESAYLGAVPSTVAFQRALASANRAIALDAEMAEAYSARAFARMALAWEWRSAEADLMQALKLDPNSAGAQGEYSTFLTYHARHDEAIAAARKAEERAPKSAAYSRKVGWALYMARRFPESIDQLRRTLDIEPGYVPARTVLGRAYALVGRHDEAIRELKAAGRGHEAKLALVLAMAGRNAEATALLQELGSPSYTLPVDPYELTVIHAALGNQAESLKHLDRAYRERDPALAFALVDPMLDPLRTTAAFQDVVRRMNFAR